MAEKRMQIPAYTPIIQYRINRMCRWMAYVYAVIIGIALVASIAALIFPYKG
jgi:hypothetical protein